MNTSVGKLRITPAVGNAEVQIHPRHLPAAFMPRLPPDQFRQKVQQVVHDHEAKGQRDQEPIRPADPLHHRVIWAPVHLHMYGTDGEFGFGDAFVTLPAGFPEVGSINGGTRVAGTENGVHAMAGGAIRRGYFPLREGQPVIAAGIGWQRSAGKS